MTREEAERVCARLATEHPDRKISQWRAREEANGDWTVVKIALPPNSPGDLTAEVRADERPATADDPRPATFRDVPPWAAG